MAATLTKRKPAGKPAEKKTKDPKPVAATQLEVAESAELRTVAERTGRTPSYLVRLAVVRMLRDARRDEVDFGKAIEEHAKAD